MNLVPTYPVYSLILIGLLWLAGSRYLLLHGLRAGGKSVVRLRLHNGCAQVQYRNGLTEGHKIKKLTMAGEWVLVQLHRPGPKIVIDSASVMASEYSGIRRELTLHTT